MAYDKIIDSVKLDGALTATADAIREKTGDTAQIQWNESTGFRDAIAGIQTLPDEVEQATPSITVSSTGLITASATQTEGYVVAGTKSATQQLATQAAKTVTPSTSNQTAVASGKYTTGAVTVKGDANLKAANILEGVSIFGVTGTLASTKVRTGTFFVTEDYSQTTADDPISITGLGFEPSMIYAFQCDSDGYSLKEASGTTYEENIIAFRVCDNITYHTDLGYKSSAVWAGDSEEGNSLIVTTNADGFSVCTGGYDNVYIIEGNWYYVAIG